MGMKILVQYPLCTVSAMHLDRVRSICSLIYKLTTSTRDYKQTIFVFKAPTGLVYNKPQSVYIGQVLHLVSTNHYISFCLLPSVYVFVWFIHVSVCASVQLHWHGHELHIKSQMGVGHLQSTGKQSTRIKFSILNTICKLK